MSLEIEPTLPSFDTLVDQGRSRVESAVRSQIDTARSQVEAQARSTLNEVAKQLPKLPKLPHIPTSPQEAIRMGLRELGLPDNPQAAASLLLKEMGATVPFPIPVPLPKSVEDAVLMGVEWAAQAYGPQVLALIGAGSIIPGIGNAVGVVVAFIKLLASAGFGPVAVPPRAWECKTGFNIPPDTAVMTPIVQMADVQTELLKVKNHRLVDPENKTGNYLTSSRVRCVTRKTAELRFLNKYVVGSEKTATLPEINAALGAFDYWKTLFARWGWKRHPSLRFETETQQIVKALQDRRAAMFKLSADVDAFLKEPPVTSASEISKRLGQLALLSRRVLAEVRIASIGVARSNKDPAMKRANLQQLAGYTRSFAVLDTVKNALIRQMNAATGHKELPRTQAGLKEQQFRLEIEGCGGSAGCETQVRSKYGKATPAPVSAPTPRPPTPRPPTPVPARASTLTPRQRLAFAAMAWKNWLRGARSDQVARRPVRPPPPIGPRNPPGTPPVWAAWLRQARTAQAARRPVPFPPAIPAAWVR